MLTGLVYINSNREWIDPNIQVINTLLGIVTDESGQVDETIGIVDEEQSYRQRDDLLISYAICGQAKLLNSFEDPHFFPRTFPTLFSTGRGGHLDPRPISVSLKAFAK